MASLGHTYCTKCAICRQSILVGGIFRGWEEKREISKLVVDWMDCSNQLDSSGANYCYNSPSRRPLKFAFESLMVRS